MQTLNKTRMSPIWPIDDEKEIAMKIRMMLSASPCGICTDIDGTISLTAPTVDQAVLLPTVPELLMKATQVFDMVATISGRGVENQRMMIGIPEVWHVGHHGYEWEEMNHYGKRKTVLYPRVKPYLSEIAIALDEIEHELKPIVSGLWMERKGITGGIHWRLAGDQKKAEKLCVPIIIEIAKKHGLRWRGGELAIEIYPPYITNKGEGLRRLVKKHNLKSVLYFGDDMSDFDAFREIKRLRKKGICEGLGFGVIHEGAPKDLYHEADIIVQRTEDIPAVWDYLLTERATILLKN